MTWSWHQQECLPHTTDQIWILAPHFKLTRFEIWLPEPNQSFLSAPKENDIQCRNHLHALLLAVVIRFMISGFTKKCWHAGSGQNFLHGWTKKVSYFDILCLYEFFSILSFFLPLLVFHNQEHHHLHDQSFASWWQSWCWCERGICWCTKRSFHGLHNLTRRCAWFHCRSQSLQASIIHSCGLSCKSFQPCCK